MNIRKRPCRGVLHTPEYANLSMWMLLGRMRYAPTVYWVEMRIFNKMNPSMHLSRSTNPSMKFVQENRAINSYPDSVHRVVQNTNG